MKMKTTKNKLLIGWREWVVLPEFGIKRIKAKIDTGARTSALDIADYELVEHNDGARVRFTVACGTKKQPLKKECVAKVRERRTVTNSGGQAEERIVIFTPIQIGEFTKDVEITLTRREHMKFRMLLGRTTIGDDFLVDASRSYLARANKSL